METCPTEDQGGFFCGAKGGITLSLEKGNPGYLQPDSVMILSASAATGHLPAADALVMSFQAKRRT